MNRKNKYTTLVSNTFLISIGTFGSKLLTFFMVRFYTEVLTPSDYGTADLIMQGANLLFPVISMGIVEGVFRFALGNPKKSRNIFSAGVWVITGGSAVLAAVTVLTWSVDLFDDVLWLMAIYTIASCYHSLCAQFIRAQGKMALYAGQGILNTVLVIGLNILFLLVFKWGIIGYVLSTAVADILCSGFLVFKEKLWQYLTVKPGKGLLTHMLRYSVPLIPTTIFWWITSVSDRYMITAFLGSDANGIYAVAAKIPTLLTLMATIFLEAWQFSAIAESAGERREHIRFYSKIWKIFMSAMFLAGGVVIALSQWEIRVLSADEYYSAWQYIPLLSAAMIFSSFVTFAGSIYVVEKKSLLSFGTSMAGAAVNILLNLILIPTELGIQGAVIPTFSSYFLVFLIRSKNARKLLPFRLYSQRLTVNCMIMAIQIIWLVGELPGWQLVQLIAVGAFLAIDGKYLVSIFSSLKSMYKGNR
ncbi:MAG TPA: polysaccharide biosynthesis C-terminal domain-containing protein [Candidatus Fimisoma avicola]|uniref:Polysaccharide biosynthesis C-terminal domain-containing protein n=1 Tax=Candidatus Fimisoma avicola TaxID=2840826 RepID=A0A9D1L7B7_9FIRM|nr:polysaccharide biosynthesis C-terminal domain-containing protein [Candidatus Fimisoma avicola]